MLIFKLFELAITLMLLVLMVTQIAIPVWKGRKLFPMFRKQGKLEMEAIALEQKAVEIALQKKLNARKKEIKDVTNQ